MEDVIAALKLIKAGPTSSEAELHKMVAEALAARGLEYKHEARLFSGARIDFLVGSVGVEVKKRAGASSIARQVRRYARAEEINSIVVAALSGVDLPSVVGGKPVATLCLSRNWGIAL